MTPDQVAARNRAQMESQRRERKIAAALWALHHSGVFADVNVPGEVLERAARVAVGAAEAIDN